MRLLLVLLSLALGACGTDKPIDFTCARINEFLVPVPVTPGGGVGLFPEALDSVFAEAASARRAGVVSQVAPATNILVLSGGGKWGAYGAGLLEGWSSAEDPQPSRRPTFDVVTGISTGALQSTFAFIGSSADPDLVSAYTIDHERELVKRHGKLFFLTHGSTASLKPLVEYARSRAEPYYERVADEYRLRQRRLLVGAVNALDGKMYAIDLTRIAAELDGKERSDCYVGALLAAAAIPVVFKQVTINGVPYFDAGVRHSVFLAGLKNSAVRGLGRSERQGNLFVLVNGVPGAAEVKRVKPTIFGALGRLREITFDQIEQSSVYAVSQEAPGLNTWVASTPKMHGCDDNSSDEDIFNPAFMRCLIEKGRKSWSGRGPWRPFPGA
ncbi:MAG TPA: patatin-like phospholipase family protein [Allosphingosinicella sp.]|jgi:predicted acylesterase/phospholipase RssA